MEKDRFGEIIGSALRIKELTKCSSDLIERGDGESWIQLIREYIVLRKRIKVLMIESPAIEILGDSDLLTIVQNISQGRYSVLDEYAIMAFQIIDKNITLEDIEMLDENEIDKLGKEQFYSWFSHYEYIQGLMDIGSLIVGIKVPPLLKEVVHEAKQCYAFQQYRAVLVLCRSILEISVKHICCRKNLFPSNRIDDFNLGKELRDAVTNNDENLRIKLKEMYREASFVIHGSKEKEIKSQDVKIFLSETMCLVQDLFLHNGMV